MAKNSTLIWIGIAVAVGYVLLTTNNAFATSVSSDQVDKIKANETFSATAYPDGTVNGLQSYSIGFGHQIQPSESALLTATLTQDQALQLLQSDLQPVVTQINNTGQNFTQGQFDALTDFGFSAGSGALNNALNAYISSGADAVPDIFLQYVYWHPVPGGAAQLNQDLVTRRNNEVNTWNS